MSSGKATTQIDLYFTTEKASVTLMSFWINIQTFCFAKIASWDSVWNDRSVGTVVTSTQYRKQSSGSHVLQRAW